MRLSEKYKNLNKDKHNSEPTWGCGDGRRYTQQINKILNNNCTVLDYGCGKGKLDIPKEYEVFRYDPCNPMYEKRPKNNYKYDSILCIDVLEHIEPECIDEVLEDINGFLKRPIKIKMPTIFFVISTRPALHKLSDGSNAHRLIKPSTWWNNKLENFFSGVVQVTDNEKVKPNECLFFANKKQKGSSKWQRI